MPQIASAKKQLRASARRRRVNDRWRARIRAELVRVRLAITAGNRQAAAEAVRAAEVALDRAARRNIIHPNKAARKKSRLRAAIAKLS